MPLLQSPLRLPSSVRSMPCCFPIPKSNKRQTRMIERPFQDSRPRGNENSLIKVRVAMRRHASMWEAIRLTARIIVLSAESWVPRNLMEKCRWSFGEGTFAYFRTSALLPRWGNPKLPPPNTIFHWMIYLLLLFFKIFHWMIYLLLFFF